MSAPLLKSALEKAVAFGKLKLLVSQDVETETVSETRYFHLFHFHKDNRCGGDARERPEPSTIPEARGPGDRSDRGALPDSRVGIGIEREGAA